MSYTPAPYVVIDGAEITPADPSAAAFTAVALDGFSVTYGRRELLSQPSPASATVELIVSDTYRTLFYRTSGKRLQIGWRSGPDNRICFNGSIASLPFTYWRTVNGHRLYRATVSATDRLADLGNVIINCPLNPDGSDGQILGSSGSKFVTPVELRTAVYNMGAYKVFAGIGGGANFFDVTSNHFYKGTTAAQILEMDFAATQEAFNYDPHTNRLEAYGRMTGQGTYPLTLQQSAAGPWEIAPPNGVMLPGWRAEATAEATATAETGVTSITVTGYERTMSDMSPADPKDWADATWTDPMYGSYVFAPRDYRIDTKGTRSAQGANALEATRSKARDLVDDAAQFVHPPLQIKYRDGFADAAEALRMIGGMATRSVYWVAGSVYNAVVGHALTLCHIGGQFSYRRPDPDAPGVWTAGLTFAPVRAGTFATVTPISGATYPARLNAVTFGQLGRSVTAEALAYTQGV